MISLPSAMTFNTDAKKNGPMRLPTYLTVRLTIVAWLFFSTLVFSELAAVEPTNTGWPQWGGPNRDHQSAALGLRKSWPEGGLGLVWKFTNAGFAYSSVAVAEGRVYSLGTQDSKNFVFCLNANSGQEIWRTELGPAYTNDHYNQGWGGGPRSTPTIAGQRLVALDDGGNCCCLDASTGKMHWQTNMISDLGGTFPNWGYSESPLVDGNRVVVCPGKVVDDPNKSEFLVALDLETGKKVLASSGYSDGAHYVSAVKHTVDGVEMYITASQSGLVGFSASTGETLWKNGSSGNRTATIPTPIAWDRYVYHTSGYGAGCVLVELNGRDGKIAATEVYANQEMQSQHGGVVLVDGNIFGYKKGGGFVCQDVKTGQPKWSHRITGDSSTSVIYADQRLYAYGESSGTCYLIDASSAGWSERGKVTLPEQSKLPRLSGRIWAHPTIAEGKLFLRDLDLIYAYDIRE